MISRREFLGYGAAGVSFVSFAGGMPRMLARAAEAAAAAEQNDHVLVVIELSGGNDGLNTLIPFEDPLYYSNRPTLGIAKEEVLKISDLVGLHPQMGALQELFQQGQVAVVQGVGYPQPDRSHFRSMEIWHTASTEATPPATGWLGRLADTVGPGEGDALPGLALTGSLPQACYADRTVVPVVAQLEGLGEGEEAGSARDKLLKKLSTVPGAEGPVGFMRKQAQAVYRTAERLQQAANSYQSQVVYPETGLGSQLRRAAQIVAADLGVRVLFVSQDGYDTHSEQGPAHAALMEDLSTSLAAFQKDLAGLKRQDRVISLVFSEFGRRVDENGSRGTDHGAASTLFVVGAGVKAGLYGAYPSLAELGDGDLVFNTDFRGVYTAILDGWMACPAEALLGGSFPAVDLIARPA
jgi:uncharacterized protein (DUF1501 family)